MHGCRDIAGSPYDSCYPADRHRTAENRLAGETIPVMPATFSIGPILPNATRETLAGDMDACTRSRNSIRYAYDSEYRQRSHSGNLTAGRVWLGLCGSIVLLHPTQAHQRQADLQSSDERRGGKECVRTYRSRWETYK